MIGVHEIDLQSLPTSPHLNFSNEIAFPSVDEKIANIAKTFVRLSPSLKIYVKYSVGHQRAFEKINKLFETEEFGGLLEAVESMPGFKSGKIASFLIKPVQRICRYPLLLKELVKSTPAEHYIFPDLQDALEAMEHTITDINEAQRQIERELNLMKAQQELRLLGMDLDVMSPTRQLVLDGPMLLVSALRKSSKSSKSPKEGHYFLFDDFFLFVRRAKKTEIPHIFIPADQILVTDPGENALEIIHVGQQIWMFILPTYHDKVFLFQKLESLIEENLKEAKRLHTRVKPTSLDLGQSKSALNVSSRSTPPSSHKPTKRKAATKAGGQISVSELFGR